MSKILSVSQTTTPSPSLMPETSLVRYVTGMVALNIPAPENTGGDWHFCGIFDSPRFPDNLTLGGEGLDWNTNPVFGNYGIHECSEILRSRGIFISPGIRVYSANHYRAILDMLYRSVSSGRIPRHLEIEGWLDSDEQKRTFFGLLDQFLPKFSFSEKNLVFAWIKLQT